MVIGVSGKANSGKNRLSEYLLEFLPEFEEKAFARKLKIIAADLTGWKDQYSREGKAHYLPEWGMTVGEFQQKLGTDAIRYGLKDDAWILALFSDYRESSNWIITDVRFYNELASIKQRDGFVIRINRDVKDDCGRDTNHISETTLDDCQEFDFVVDNNYSLDELKSTAEMIASIIRKRM